MAVLNIGQIIFKRESRRVGFNLPYLQLAIVNRLGGTPTTHRAIEAEREIGREGEVAQG